MCALIALRTVPQKSARQRDEKSAKGPPVSGHEAIRGSLPIAFQRSLDTKPGTSAGKTRPAAQSSDMPMKQRGRRNLASPPSAAGRDVATKAVCRVRVRSAAPNSSYRSHTPRRTAQVAPMRVSGRRCHSRARARLRCRNRGDCSARCNAKPPRQQDAHAHGYGYEHVDVEGT